MSKMAVACDRCWCGPFRSMWTQTSKKIKKSPFFSGRLPRVLPARENLMSTQGAVQKILGKVKCLCGVFLVWWRPFHCMAPVLWSHGRRARAPPSLALPSSPRQRWRTLGSRVCLSLQGTLLIRGPCQRLETPPGKTSATKFCGST